MNAGNAARVIESGEPEAHFESSEPLQQGALIYSWKPASGYLAAAFQHAFSFRYQFLKRSIDIALSLFLLVILFPLGVAIALGVRISSPGPIFYCEERSGRFRVPFRILKFRSMFSTQPPSNVLNISTAQQLHPAADRLRKKLHNARITPIGRVLRRTSMDELPQLWNVLVGDMSLVGPRPIVEAERMLYSRDLPYYDLFRPGITGLWQVTGRSDVEYDRRVLCDREYASQWSCLLDFVILARTIPAVISMRGAY
ncbi:MAG TPA: sugar transferase [Terracidiphilus sp.]|jgi:undecaprenyl-phosphate galactose phosphotransferase